MYVDALRAQPKYGRGITACSRGQQEQQWLKFRQPWQAPRALGQPLYHQQRRLPISTAHSSSWGSGSGADGDSPEKSRFAGLFGGQKNDRNVDNSSYRSMFRNDNSSTGTSRSSSSKSRSGSLLAAAAADSPPRWVLVALVPTVLWCITWSLTGGLVTLAHSSVAGMVSVARLLFPSLPLRGVDYQDIAVSLVKALQTATDTPDTWSRPGLWLPAWLLRGVMSVFFSLASGSSAVASTLLAAPQWMVLSGVCKALMYGTCLLLMLPLGASLNNLIDRVLKDRPFRWPRLSDNTLLTLKLAGVLAWPCISASAVLRPSLLPATAANKAAASSAAAAAGAAAAAASSSPASATAAGSGAAAAAAAAVDFVTMTLQVSVCCLLLVLLLAVAAVAGHFCWQVAREQASSEVVTGFGLQVGLLCAVQASVNVAQMCLNLISQTLTLRELVMPLLSTLVLGRIVWSVWRLHRIDANAPSLWLQVLTLTVPALPAAGAAAAAGGAGAGGGTGSGSGGGTGGTGGARGDDTDGELS